MVKPVAPASVTLAPDSAPAVESVPPLFRLRSALPVFRAPAGKVRSLLL